MRPWVCHLTLAATRRCAGSSGKGKWVPLGSPLLADRLGAKAVEDAASPEVLPGGRKPSKVVPSEGPADAATMSTKERRLVATALKPVAVLPQTSLPVLPLKLPATGQIKQGLPSSVMEALKPWHGRNVEQSAAAAEDLSPAGSGLAAGPKTLPARRLRPKASGVSAVPVPLRTRQIICGVLFEDFVAESRQEGFQLRANAREKAVNFSQRGEIVSLVRLFRRLELKRAAAGTGEGAPQFRVMLKPGGEQAILGLFLDDELSWERARQNLRHQEVPSEPGGEGESKA